MKLDLSVGIYLWNVKIDWEDHHYCRKSKVKFIHVYSFTFVQLKSANATCFYDFARKFIKKFRFGFRAMVICLQLV